MTLFSLIRFAPPLHAIRRPKRNIAQRSSTKIVAAPLVTATAVVGLDSALGNATATHHRAASTGTLAVADRAIIHWRLAQGAPIAPAPVPVTTSVTAATVLAPAATTIPGRSSTTNTVRPRPRSAPSAEDTAAHSGGGPAACPWAAHVAHHPPR